MRVAACGAKAEDEFGLDELKLDDVELTAGASTRSIRAYSGVGRTGSIARRAADASLFSTSTSSTLPPNSA